MTAPTGCRCEGPGWCPLQGREVCAVRQHTCKHLGYFAAFVGKRSKVADSTVPVPPATTPARPHHGLYRDPAELPCPHRGEPLREISCKPCTSGGVSQVYVYRCEQFAGGCTLNNITPRQEAGKAPERYEACATCRVRLDALDAEEERTTCEEREPG